MNELYKDLLDDKKFLEVANNINDNRGPVVISGLSDVGEVQFISALKDSLNKKFCIVTYNELQARRLARDFKYFFDNIEIFSKREIATYDYTVSSKDISYERIDVLNKMFRGEVDIVITTIEAVMQSMVAKDTLYQNIIKLKVGNECKIEDLKRYLINLGYESADMIEGRGMFSVRGGIVDISLDEKYGIRVEFWGDEIDSIRKFEILSQRSTEMLDDVSIFPAHEFILEKDFETIKNRIDEYGKCIPEDKELIISGNYLSKVDKYFDLFYKNQDSILDYIDNEYVLILDEESKISKRCESIKQDCANLVDTLVDKSKIVPDIIEKICKYNYDFGSFNYVNIEKIDVVSGRDIYSFKYRDVNYYKSETDILIRTLENAIKQKKKTIILGGTEENGFVLPLYKN